MSNLVLKSVGCVVDDEGMTHPIEFDGCVNMTPDVSVHLLDTDNEWWDNMSVEDSNELMGFLTPLFFNNVDFGITNFVDWGMERLQYVINHQYIVERYNFSNMEVAI